MQDFAIQKRSSMNDVVLISEMKPSSPLNIQRKNLNDLPTSNKTNRFSPKRQTEPSTNHFVSLSISKDAASLAAHHPIYIEPSTEERDLKAAHGFWTRAKLFNQPPGTNTT